MAQDKALRCSTCNSTDTRNFIRVYPPKAIQHDHIAAEEPVLQDVTWYANSNLCHAGKASPASGGMRTLHRWHADDQIRAEASGILPVPCRFRARVGFYQFWGPSQRGFLPHLRLAGQLRI